LHGKRKQSGDYFACIALSLAVLNCE
jgi:hypothetical protein